MMKRIAAVLIMVCLLFALTGCGREQDPESHSRLLLGFSQLGSESSWRIGNTKDVEEQAKVSGVNLMMRNANQKQSNQIDAIRSFIAYQVDVIAFAPIVEDGWDHVLAEARQAGIPVILLDRMIRTEDESLYTCLIGADFYREGVMAGEYLLRKANDLGLDSVNIVEITGTEDSTPMRQRAQGFRDTIAGDPRMTILESVNGDFLKSRGGECMRYLLKTYGDGIDAVFSHNDDMTLGALPEIREAGLEPGRDILIISIDGSQEAIDQLKAGNINCVVECTPMLGKTLMETAMALKEGREIARETHPEEKSFSDYDDLAALAPRGY